MNFKLFSEFMEDEKSEIPSSKMGVGKGSRAYGECGIEYSPLAGCFL
ncbi:MAG: hypothetical protein K9N21_15110 [Deltaproteobacteria bacterium]|nr:hypothetical protein [Deltaproteobacteria bacterium]